MGAQRIGAHKSHQNAGHAEHADFEAEEDADRQTEPQDARDLGQDAHRQPDRHLRRHPQHVAGQREQHQPLHDGRRAAGTGAAESGQSEMAEDQHPIERRVDRDRAERHEHHDARSERGDQQKPKYRKPEKRRRAPADHPQVITDLGCERGLVAEQREQQGNRGQDRDDRQRQCRRDDQPGAGDTPGGRVVVGADRVCCQRRHRGQHALAQHRHHIKQHPAEPGGGERRGAELADHDRVRDAHRHLRQIGGCQRRGDAERRADFRQDGRALCGHGRRLGRFCDCRKRRAWRDARSWARPAAEPQLFGFRSADRRYR